jgi:membrane-associated protease RseP (regulator of RpoE activity)
MSRARFSWPRGVATALPIALLAAPALPQPTEVRDSGILLPAKLDAEGASQMLIPIRVQGHTFWCNADSGGSRVLSLDLTKALNAGLQPNTTGTHAGVGPDVSRDQRVRGITVEIGTVALHDMTIVLAPRPTVVPDIDCVLGLGVLREYAVEFDYLAPSVRLIPASEFHPPLAAASIPIVVDRIATPSAKVRLGLDNGDAIEATLMVDTGASYYDVVLLKPFVDAHQVARHVGTVVPRFSDTRGMTITAARAPAVTVGPYEINGPVVAFIETASAGTFTVDGLLGTGFLRRFKVTFDYSRNQLWLEPNGRPRGPQPFDASGVQVRATDAHEFAVVDIAANSAAADAGLHVGDLLETVDGRPARDMTLGEIQDALNRAGETCTVQVERDGQTHTARLRLRRRL